MIILLSCNKILPQKNWDEVFIRNMTWYSSLPSNRSSMPLNQLISSCLIVLFAFMKIKLGMKLHYYEKLPFWGKQICLPNHDFSLMEFWLCSVHHLKRLIEDKQCSNILNVRAILHNLKVFQKLHPKYCDWWWLSFQELEGFQWYLRRI